MFLTWLVLEAWRAMSSNSNPQAEAHGTSSKRSRRAERYQEWESIKGEVGRLYIEEDKTLQETMQEVEQKLEFTSRYGSPVPASPRSSPAACNLHYQGKYILKSSIARGNGRWSLKSGTSRRIWRNHRWMCLLRRPRSALEMRTKIYCLLSWEDRDQ